MKIIILVTAFLLSLTLSTNETDDNNTKVENSDQQPVYDKEIEEDTITTTDSRIKDGPKIEQVSEDEREEELNNFSDSNSNEQIEDNPNPDNNSE